MKMKLLSLILVSSMLMASAQVALAQTTAPVNGVTANADVAKDKAEKPMPQRKADMAR